MRLPGSGSCVGATVHGPILPAPPLSSTTTGSKGLAARWSRHACSKPSCHRNRRSSPRSRVPLGIGLGHYSVAAISASRDNRSVPIIACLPGGIRIVVKGREHLPAHIHAEEGGVDVLIIIATGEVYSGGISTYGLAAARAYVAEHRAALVAEFCARNPTLPRGAQ